MLNGNVQTTLIFKFNRKILRDTYTENIKNETHSTELKSASRTLSKAKYSEFGRDIKYKIVKNLHIHTHNQTKQHTNI